MIARALYHWALLPLALGAVWLAARGAPRLRAHLAARRGVWDRLRQAAARRDPTRPLVWFHAASAGELLQAEPVMRRVREGGAQVAVTLSSVSGQRWLARVEAWPELVWADLLPFDLPGAAARLFAALRPTALVFVQADLWPGLVWEAARRGVPQAVVAARLGGAGPLRRWLGAGRYGRKRCNQALTEAERARLARWVPGHAGLMVGGDPGIETVFQRLAEVPAAALPAALTRGEGPVLVIGSSWPADERRWLPAVVAALAAHPALRVVVAPHEPTEPHLAALEAALAAFGPRRLSAAAEAAARVWLVDSVGKLAALYQAGSLAYVGGGFSTGVHNVAEPAAAGLPVLFGPRHGKSAMAQALLAAGAATAVTDAAGLRAARADALADPERCAARGRTARDTVTAEAGAAARCFEALRAAIPAIIP